MNENKTDWRRQEEGRYDSELVEDFIAFVKGRPRESDVASVLLQSYGRDAALAMAYLLLHVDDAVLRRFAAEYFYPRGDAAETPAQIVVRPLQSNAKARGNVGHFVICVYLPDGTEQQLHFVNQYSCVYYLMYLIDRKTHDGPLDVLRLEECSETFISLYTQVYNTSRIWAYGKYRTLLRRQDGTRFRAGRESEAIYDIRIQLEKAFDVADCSPRPYSMTARRHLTVSPDRIVFVGEAESLLNLDFRQKRSPKHGFWDSLKALMHNW